MGSILALPLNFILGIIFLKPSDYIHWCKWITSYIYIKMQLRTRKRRFDLYDYSVENDPVKVNFLNPPEEYAMDSPQPESHLLKNEDEVFFYGANSKSELLVANISRQLNNRASACIYIKLSSGKTYHLEKTADFQQSCVDEMTFSCGGLQLQCNTPMRAWRLFYTGYLREISEDEPEKGSMVYVKFALIWKAASDVYDFASDIPIDCLADGLANLSWKNFKMQWRNLQKALDFYGQAGVIHGTVTVGEGTEDKEIYLFGQRIRYIGDTSCFKELKFRHILGYVKENGAYVHVGKISASNISNDFTFGFAVTPDCSLKSINKGSVSIFPSDSSEKENLKIQFQTDLSSYKVIGSSKMCFPLTKNTETKDKVLSWLDFKLNGKVGYGIQVNRTESRRSRNEISEIHITKAPSVIPPIIHFKEEICQLSEITGGKGSSLGKLTQLSKELQSFIVPTGVVVSTSAYAYFLTDDILDEVKILETKSFNKNSDSGEISEACKRVSESIVQTEFPNTLRESIERKLNEYFGEKIQTGKFAIRSSATGEDTEQMSAAGQMETFLGVSGINEILLAVKKCWSSQFSFIATEYKRRYGQVFNSPMAVVIQEMVSCDVAGVLFTCDPLTGNPTLMSITSNFGLGESVVSGTEEPDTIQLKRDENDKLSIKSISIGAKSRKIVLKDNEGIDVVDIPENEKILSSLTEEMALFLGNTAIKIEKYYRSHRDIEWGFFNNTLYIFQSRPVTSGTNETIYEIEHEFDSAMRVENDFYSCSNVGEVLPNAASPIAIIQCMKAFGLQLNCVEKATIFQLKGRTQYFNNGWVFMYNRFVFNVADVFPLRPNEELSILKKSTLISFFGRVPDNKEMFDVTRARCESVPEPSSLKTMYMVLKGMLFSNKRLNACKIAFSKYKMPIEQYNTAKELFYGMLRCCTGTHEVSMCHMICTQTSSLWNMMIFSTLGAAQGDFDDMVYNDFANLLKTDTDVESADVPSAMQSIAYHISKAISSEEFRKLSPEEALEWLQSSQDIAGKKFREFLRKHGHRCLQEFDLYSYTWREAPTALVKILQNLIGYVPKDKIAKKTDNLSELISQLNVPLGFFQKLLLRIILPFCRKAVQNRETTKSMIIKGVDGWRQAFRKLAKLMVQEGRIPEEDLLYFMTFDDIQKLLETRSPKVINRAFQRKRRYPVLRSYRFPEIWKGILKPIDETKIEIIANGVNFSMKGIPVSQGIVKGYIRRAVTLEEAVHIQPGEILLTYATDIGWSPYFPQLAGVVTELGGLISHGAVVSREYGIPCIAGLHGAMQHFQSGDYVVLDGNKGILQKLEPPES